MIALGSSLPTEHIFPDGQSRFTTRVKLWSHFLNCKIFVLTDVPLAVGGVEEAGLPHEAEDHCADAAQHTERAPARG